MKTDSILAPHMLVKLHCFHVVVFLGLAGALRALAGEAVTSLLKAPETDTNTILLLHLDDGAGRIARDASGNGNHGRIGAAAWCEGKFGKALRFEGKDGLQGVNCGGERGQPASFDFGESTDFTVDLWLRTTSAERYMNVINKKSRPEATEAGFMISTDSGRMTAILADGVKSVLLSHPTPINDGKWHHVALVAERKGEATLYVDGEPSKSGSLRDLIDLTNPRRDLRIGDRGHDWAFEGVIDEVRISAIVRQFNR